MLKRIVFLIPAIIWMIVIISLTLQTGDVSGGLSGGITIFLYNIIEGLGLSISMDNLHLLIRKLAHFSEYFILGLLVFLALTPYKISFKQKLLVVLCVGVGFAIIDETIQLFIPGRAGSIFDVAIDSLGVLLSIFIVNVWFSLRKKLEV